MTEQQFTDAVIELATLQRWAVHHDRPARRSGTRWATAIQGHAGFPDLVLTRRGVVIFRELKAADRNGRMGRLSSEQRDWARQLLPGWPSPVLHGSDRTAWLFDVWTPDDWPLIVSTLTVRLPVVVTEDNR